MIVLLGGVSGSAIDAADSKVRSGVELEIAGLGCATLLVSLLFRETTSSIDASSAGWSAGS